MAQAASTYKRDPMAKDKSSNLCNYCLFGKQHRVSFQKNSTQKLEKLKLVYSDVCGPIEVDSLGGNKYFVTFIDDTSRKTWVYLLHIKSHVFQYFHKIHAMVERETRNPLKRLRTDNGKEYISMEFKEYCPSMEPNMRRWFLVNHNTTML